MRVKIKILSFLFLTTMAFSANTKPTTKANAYIEPNAHKVSSEYVRIVIAPDGDAKKDSWNKDGAITAIVVIEDGGSPISKGGSLKYGDSGSRHLIEHDRQYRPDSGNYSLGGSGAADYVANGNKSLKLWYFNVRYDLIAGKRFQVARLNPTVTDGSYTAWNITEAVLFNDANITKVWKIELGSGSWSNLWFSGSIGTTLSNQSVSYVLEGYLTCSTSTLNGYMAYPGLNVTFSLDGRTASTTTLKDFDYETYDENTTYEVGRPNNSGSVTTTVGNKVLAMKALYEAHTPPSPVKLGTSVNYNSLFFISCLILVAATGCFLLPKKTKHDDN